MGKASWKFWVELRPAAFLARFSLDLSQIRQSSWIGPVNSTFGASAPRGLAGQLPGGRVYTAFTWSGDGYDFTENAALPTNPSPGGSALVVGLPADLVGDRVFADGFEDTPSS